MHLNGADSVFSTHENEHGFVRAVPDKIRHNILTLDGVLSNDSFEDAQVIAVSLALTNLAL